MENETIGKSKALVPAKSSSRPDRGQPNRAAITSRSKVNPPAMGKVTRAGPARGMKKARHLDDRAEPAHWKNETQCRGRALSAVKVNASDLSSATWTWRSRAPRPPRVVGSSEEAEKRRPSLEQTAARVPVPAPISRVDRNCRIHEALFDSCSFYFSGAGWVFPVAESLSMHVFSATEQERKENRGKICFPIRVDHARRGCA